MAEDNKKPTAEVKLHAETNVTFKRSFTRKDPQTGKSNYPTLRKFIINRNYFINGKQIKNNNYQGNKDDKTSK